MDLPRVGISEIEDLGAARLAAVRIATAADGLPLVLVVDRGESPEELLAPLAARLGYGEAEDYQDEPLGAVVEQAARLLRERDLQQVETPSGRRECFISRQPLGRISGATLLSRLLTPGAVQLPAPNADQAMDTRATAFEQEQQPRPPGSRDPAPRVRAELGELRLVLPLDASGTDPALASRRIHREDRTYQFLAARPLVPETLAAFGGGHWRGESPHHLFPPVEGPVSDLAGYQAAREEALLAEHFATWTFHVPRQEVCGAVLSVARGLAGLHAAGEVHGDVKPANVLATAAGVECIDSLALTPGLPSVALTPGWAAPEQVIGQPVSPATDQYPLGLMLCRLLGGVVYGEEVTVVVPTGGSSTERFTMMKNPGVYLDAQSAPVAAAGVPVWQGLLARCLAFEPSHRYPTTEELIAELERVLATHPLQRDLACPLAFGSLARTDAADPRPELAWMVDEQAPALGLMD